MGEMKKIMVIAVAVVIGNLIYAKFVEGKI